MHAGFLRLRQSSQAEISRALGRGPDEPAAARGAQGTRGGDARDLVNGPSASPAIRVHGLLDQMEGRVALQSTLLVEDKARPQVNAFTCERRSGGTEPNAP